jgi:serine/threonine-protein kinase
MLLGAVSNALDVSFTPRPLRALWQSGLRDRLWQSRAGAWLARGLGAPRRARTVDAAAFRATEAVLGVAAGELFAALPGTYRRELATLPPVVEALEARAAAARAELALLSGLGEAAGRGHAPDGVRDLEPRRARAQRVLSDSVAALEGIRVDLLRLHAGANDLAPLTTLLDAAREASADVQRLVEGRREAEAALDR